MSPCHKALMSSTPNHRLSVASSGSPFFSSCDPSLLFICSLYPRCSAAFLFLENAKHAFSVGLLQIFSLHTFHPNSDILFCCFLQLATQMSCYLSLPWPSYVTEGMGTLISVYSLFVVCSFPSSFYFSLQSVFSQEWVFPLVWFLMNCRWLDCTW